MKKQFETTIDIDNDGNLFCLYTDEIDLFAVGRIVNVQKTSNVEFNEQQQFWEVRSLEGKVLYTNTSRELAIEWEVKEFSPGGTHYAQSTL